MIKTATLILFFISFSFSQAAPGPRHTASGKKSGKYQSSGFFSSGNKEVTVVKLKDIRRANSNEGYDRVVFELEAQSEQTDVPYFQVQAALQESRIIVSIWADVQYDFNPEKIAASVSKSQKIKKITVLPRVEEGLSVVEISLSNPKVKMESFYLTKPNRVIVDIL